VDEEGSEKDDDVEGGELLFLRESLLNADLMFIFQLVETVLPCYLFSPLAYLRLWWMRS
jgi:hypothetical protein